MYKIYFKRVLPINFLTFTQKKVYPKTFFYCFVFGSTTLTFVYFSLELIYY